MLQDAEEAAAYGWGTKELAEYWGVSQRSVERWARRYPNLLGEALRAGARRAEAKVAGGLLRQATGQIVRRETIKPLLDAAGQPMLDSEGRVLHTVEREYFPPSEPAGEYLLGNRAPERWRSVQRIAVEGEQRPLQPLVLVLPNGNGAGEQPERAVELTAVEPAALPETVDESH